MDEEFKIGFGQALDLLASIAQSLKTIAERMPAKPGEFSTLWSVDEPDLDPAVTRPSKTAVKAKKTAQTSAKQETVYDLLLTIDYLQVTEDDTVVTAYIKWLVVLKLCCHYYPGVTAKLLFSRLGLGMAEVRASKAKLLLRQEIERKVLQYKLSDNSVASDLWPYKVYGLSNRVQTQSNFDALVANSSNKELTELFDTLYARVKTEADNTPWIALPVESFLD